MQRTSFAPMHCSLARGLDLIGDWWTPLIVRDLFLGLSRFDELAEDLGISRNLLTRRLAALVKNGIVKKHAYSSRPPRYDYRLSPAGLDLVPIIVALTAWGDRWSGHPEGPPVLFRHTSCGQVVVPEITCPACHGRMAADTIRALPGPGGAIAPGTRVLARRLAGQEGGNKT